MRKRLKMAFSLFRSRPEQTPGAGDGIQAFAQSTRTIAGANIKATQLQGKAAITARALELPGEFLKQRAALIDNIVEVAQKAATAMLTGLGNVTIAPQGKRIQFLIGEIATMADPGLNISIPGVVGPPQTGWLGVDQKDMFKALLVNLSSEISQAMLKIISPIFTTGQRQAEKKLERS